jgi:predicted CoA-binding protein
MAKVVAVIGASSDRRRYGNKAVRAFGHKGFTVVPVTPSEAEVEGLKAYPTVLDVPGAIDMATFYVRPEIGLRVIDEVAGKGIPEIWLNPGAGSPDLERKAQALGIRTVSACSILGIGEDPSRY